MAERKVERAQNRRTPAGALRHRVYVEKRVHRPGGFGNADTDFEFSPAFGQSGRAWCAIRTPTGRTWFDGVATERKITHVLRFRFRPEITSEAWIRLGDGTRLDVVEVNPLDERKVFVEALCEATGSASREAAG